MLYYSLKFDQLPRVTFAHAFTKINYSMEFKGGSNNLEIVYIEKGATMIETEGISETVGENTLFFAFKKNRLVFKPLKDKIHTHYTVNINFDHELEVFDDTKERTKEDPCLLILPLYISLNENTAHFRDKLKDILWEHGSCNSLSGFKCSAKVLDLMTDISRHCLAQMNSVHQDFTPSQFIICNRIKRYISDNLNKPITLMDIARTFDKTPNYLNYVFKKVTGIPIKQYVNQVRINHVINMITYYNITLKDAGIQVGIYDQNYLSRLFKRVTSMSAKNYFNR